MLQKAGRHGGYATQFWTKRRTAYRTRHEALTAHSVKSIQRRLVLPLEAHDWSRALEVLRARYALLGRTTLDYQRVIRGIAADNVSPFRIQTGVKLLNELRDEVYAGDVKADGVWVTLLWAYVHLGRPLEGYECLLQAKRRVKMSALTWHHMGETLIPLLAEFGMLAEARYVFENFMQVGGSLQEKERMSHIIAEAAARSGSWTEAIQAICRSTGDVAVEKVEPIVTKPTNPTLASLFVAEAPGSTPGVGRVRTPIDSGSLQNKRLTTEAVRSMMYSMARDGQWTLALGCLHELWGRQMPCAQQDSHTPRCASISVDGVAPASVSSTSGDVALQPLIMTSSEMQQLLNALGDQKRWKEAVRLFRDCYLSGCTHPLVRTSHPLKPLTLNLLFSAFPRETRELTLTNSGEEPELSHLDHMDSKRQQISGVEKVQITLQLDVVCHPDQVVVLLDQLLLERDDIVITDCMMGTVGPALVQLGQWDRALHLLRQVPELFPTKEKHLRQHEQLESAETKRRIRQHLVALLFYLYSAVSLEARYYTILHFPHVFPAEMFSSMPPPKELAASLRELQQQRIEKCEKKEALRHFASRRRSRTVQRTEQMDAELRERLTLLHSKRANAFCVEDDPERDPRPIPKGLHDTASGWNFYGRGGEMVFMNHRRTAHPFSMHPKVMRSLADPYRGWGLKQNSCWAHRERVKKWNGNSAV
ncbi:uncharacterized protein TEOVI_000917900 [Trypanosoma equiperdum]|uniref:Uncharacterized protein n=2 Tax=Trypanozoon TaxID=39700 RepID=Q57XM5_TRYB2|nr:hypothetical protein, conserved [Trypanosoma brucei brucei TREU927]AAX69644.1 hypothetical protein, conserved [Trypanosoma brucei]AAZ12313.1 hypothetical protein, conserved [Trypanosoma brucei brucei TREU927]SCU68873.1 hypothetical protein, conserved [Trypanosoma equiperdum]